MDTANFTVTASEICHTYRVCYLLTLESDDAVAVVSVATPGTEQAADFNRLHGLRGAGYLADGTPVTAVLHAGADRMPQLGEDLRVEVAVEARATNLREPIPRPAGSPDAANPFCAVRAWLKDQALRARFHAAFDAAVAEACS